MLTSGAAVGAGGRVSFTQARWAGNEPAGRGGGSPKETGGGKQGLAGLWQWTELVNVPALGLMGTQGLRAAPGLRSQVWLLVGGAEATDAPSPRVNWRQSCALRPGRKLQSPSSAPAQDGPLRRGLPDSGLLVNHPPPQAAPHRTGAASGFSGPISQSPLSPGCPIPVVNQIQLLLPVQTSHA